MDWLFIAALAVASSIDNLAVGLSYGVRGIRIGHGANLIIAAICFAFSEIGILFGHWVGTILPGSLPHMVGATLLFVIGVRILLLLLPRKPEAHHPTPANPWRTFANWFNRVLAVESGKIGLTEALLLGVALSANALANAIGAGLLHMSVLAVALSASFGSLVTISAGVALGLRVSQFSIGTFDLGRFGALLSGVILVGLAIGQIL